MNNKRTNAGFTLFEMIVAITAASIVTLAATTMMLFALRINAQTRTTITQQSTTNILMSTLENLTLEGAIKEIKQNDLDWEIISQNNDVMYSYRSAEQTLYAGLPTPGNMLVEGVTACKVELVDKLLTFSIWTEDQMYTSTVYCRLKPPAVEDEDSEQGGDVVDDLQGNNPGNGNITETNTSRIEFLRTLANQYKLAGGQANNGLILDNKTSTGEYYSQWYCSTSGIKWNENGWNASTAWCACFLSWGLNECRGSINSVSIPRTQWYASVDDFVAYFKSGREVTDANGNVTGGHYWIDNADFFKVRPGDLIIFDWNLDNDPSHIGAVLLVDGDRVYTIEGNTTNRVGVRSYKLTDPRILGYGVIDWAPSAP